MKAARQFPHVFSDTSPFGSNGPKAERLSPQAQVLAELVKLERRGKGGWVVVAFAGVVVVLGALSFLVPHAFWPSGVVEVSLSPGVVFVFLVATVLVALIDVRRDVRLHGDRLASLQVFSPQKWGNKLDVLTNVLSRDTLRGLLELEILRAERNRRPLALIMGGVNGLKPINTRYNPLMGDYVLSQVASILKDSVRGCDYVVRCGNDEFLLLLPDTNEKGAATVFERIRRNVTEWDRSNRVGEIPVSISLGLYFHVAGQTPEKDVAEAAIRMYADQQPSQRGASVAPSLQDCEPATHR